MPTPPTPQAAKSASSEATPVNVSQDEIATAWRESGERWERLLASLIHRRQAREEQQAERRSQHAPKPRATEGRTLTLAGYGAGLHVDRGQLVCQHGTIHSEQEPGREVLARAVHGVGTIVWLTNGGSGNMSLAALHWCAEQNVTVVLLRSNGKHLATIHPDPDAPAALGTPNQNSGRTDITVRRRQYEALWSGRDVALARSIVRRKIAGQHATALRHTELPDQKRALDATSQALTWLDLETAPPFLSTVDGVRLLEARAARGYFRGWQGLPLNVERTARERWPAHWLTVSERNSPLSRYANPRRAANPAQAALNFVYGVLEGQVRQSLHAYGFDLAVAFLHADSQGRESLVYDVMEPCRGAVDDLFLKLLGSHTFMAGDFQVRTDGSVSMVELCRLPQSRVDDIARWLRSQLLVMNESHDWHRPK